MKTIETLARAQIDTTLNTTRPLLKMTAPVKGWIRAIRNALSMSGRQLAKRLNVSKQRVAQIENEELAGSITIKNMQRIAESLDCHFVHSFVPRKSLEQTMHDQALKIARQHLARASQTMSLENQALSKNENKEILLQMVEELVNNPPKNLWDQP